LKRPDNCLVNQTSFGSRSTNLLLASGPHKAAGVAD
jgi:hypothetical protein